MKVYDCVMVVSLPDTERQLLRRAQRACRGKAGYVPVTVLLLFDRGRAVAAIAEDLGLDESTVYRYAQTYQLRGLLGYLRAEPPGYWGSLTSAQLAGLCRELYHQLYTYCRPIADWLAATYGVRYAVSGLTDLLHRLGFSYKLTTVLPCQADAVAQTAFLTDTLAPLLVQAAAGDAVVYFVDAALPTHNTRATHVWTETGKERPLLTVSGRERVNLNAALNALPPRFTSTRPTASTPKAPSASMKNYSPPTPQGSCTSSATTPATKKTRPSTPGWPISASYRFSYPRTRPI